MWGGGGVRRGEVLTHLLRHTEMYTSPPHGLLFHFLVIKNAYKKVPFYKYCRENIAISEVKKPLVMGPDYGKILEKRVKSAIFQRRKLLRYG